MKKKGEPVKTWTIYRSGFGSIHFSNPLRTGLLQESYSQWLDEVQE